MLRATAESWRSEKVLGLAGVVRAELSAVEGTLQQRLADLQGDRAATKQRIADEDEAARVRLAEAEQKVAELARFVTEDSREAGDALAAWHRDSRDQLRREMREIMRAGVTDGPRLDEVLRDKEEEALASLVDLAAELQQRSRMKLAELAMDLVAAFPSAPAVRFVVAGREARGKLEGVLDPAGSTGGGLAGMAAGGYYGAIAGTAVGGPVGTLVGGVLGSVVGGALGGGGGAYLGAKARQGVTGRRAQAAEPEVWGAIDRFLDGAHDDYLGVVQQLGQALRTESEVWLQTRREAIERELTERTAVLEETESARSELKEQWQQGAMLVATLLRNLDSASREGTP